jgi:diguanylate cyclase (GGDEF)-like protein
MPNLFHGVGLLGAELPLSALGALLLLVLYRGLRDEGFLRSWMIFEFSQTAFLSGTLFLLFHDPLPTGQHVIQIGSASVTFLIGGLGPLFLFQGFREAAGQPLSLKNRIYVSLLFLGSGVVLANAALRGGQIQFLNLSIFGDLAMASVALYIAIVGFRGRATRVLAIGCGLKFLSLVPKFLLLVALALHHAAPPGGPSPQASVYLSILLLQSATSGLIILGMVNVVVHKHQRIQQSLDQTMQQLTAANLELDHLAGIDHLTNLANRRSLESHLAIEWRRAMRSEHDSLSIIAIDIDHFKKLNDTCGHPAGDACLKMLASLLREIFRREEDLVARVGGDEFIVLLTGIDAHATQSLAERTRVQFEASSVHYTLSIGWVTVKPTPGLKPDMLLHRADQALYRAKQNGRNQVFCLPLLASEKRSASVTL